MYRFFVWTVLLPLVIAGCGPQDFGDDDDDDNDTTSSPTQTATPGEANPRTGVWRYDEFTPVMNNCNYTDPIPGQDSGNFELVNNGNGTFTVTPDDNTPAFDCTIDEHDFDCPERATGEIDLSGEGVAAVLDVTGSADGSFEDDETAVGKQSAFVDCTGSDCSLVETQLMISFPCVVQVAFTARHDSPL